MNFGMVVTLRVREGREAEYRAAMTELASFVAATEPDTLLYAPFQTRGQMGIYVVLELYRSEAAHKAHLQNIQGLACFARLAELIAERTCVLSLDPLGDTPNSELVGAEFRHCSLE
ncbi:MAG TPA: antibiotic biosynthesis monooxygenase [Phenylobacterium sp.]|uniref:putative quinol monooxygenase n=1 Tax=Phenylobacterium sp. TaxID=1871053 RepID=UPI002B484966|nr:antibiotic biosynthesis monooxygenase [Phenylobacterium sp.]HKR87851.1 antibiotic biosynthesis monooxygenase [Phenylobacterium sp.]